MITWINALSARKKILVYCSDGSGAFDRVDADLVAQKLVNRGVHFRLIGLIRSWLAKRFANVVVAGKKVGRLCTVEDGVPGDRFRSDPLESVLRGLVHSYSTCRIHGGGFHR